MIKKAFISIFLMLTVAPFTATFALVHFDQSNWGLGDDIKTILEMSIFGLITVPLWLTYIPALIITPIYMQKQATKTNYHTSSIGEFTAKAIIKGAIGGVIVLAPAWMRRVAVGMPVARHPPHRSVREELPHTAPALGSDA